jgi:hypothetical protein
MLQRGGHQPRRLPCGNDGDVLSRHTIDDAARERASDEAKWIDSGDTCPQNLMQVSA